MPYPISHLIPRRRDQATVAVLTTVLFGLAFAFSGGKTGYAPASDEPVIRFQVDINRAEAPELQTLPGIGEKLAEGIILYREETGPFESIEEIRNVRGIGPKKLAVLRPHLLKVLPKRALPNP